MNKKILIEQLQIINQLYPSDKTELYYETHWQLLMAVMMSAQATDKQVNKITEKLWPTIKGPQDILDLGFDKLTQAIRSINYFNTKAKHIFISAGLLTDEIRLDKHGTKLGELPQDLKTLTLLPGVGVKTAKVVLSQLFNQAHIAVDTHVHRVCNRLGRVKTSDPLKTSALIEKVIPGDMHNLAHHSLILFGRYFCTARSPKCVGCPLQQQCKWFKAQKKSSAK